MTYKNKIIALSGVIAALVIIYVLTLILDPQRADSRADAYSWLEPGVIDRITGIGVTKNGETVNLTRNGGKWFVTRAGKDYPARQTRVEDFVAALSKRDSYPVRSTGASSHERLSLTPDTAVKVTVSAGAGPPALTLLIGQTDPTGQNVYLRKLDLNEVRSGEDRFSPYTDPAPASWYNLRLFPENGDGKLNDSDVQRFTVYPPDEGAPMIFTRSGREWTFNFEISNPDFGKVDSYLRDFLGVSGSDFIDGTNPSDSMFNTCRVVIELGNGVTKTLRAGPADEEGGRYATVSDSGYVYSLPSRAVNRIFAGPDSFKADNPEN